MVDVCEHLLDATWRYITIDRCSFDVKQPVENNQQQIEFDTFAKCTHLMEMGKANIAYEMGSV